ncbi:hypothetical protein [Nitrosomonas sp.]|uniref:hypothetical protein n=1 Tax=Nitrosomonas sp. TaxID=42353 RepID=UPI0025F705B4|nr:hypothetical protein [Nitrosomonas sp.]
MMRIHRSILEPIYEDPVYETRIEGYDKGLINSWQIGRQLAQRDTELVAEVLRGELPSLGVKGGIDKKKKPKFKFKYGCLWYLAQLQGLKGVDLDVDLNQEVELVCSRTKIKVIFTSDMSKYCPPEEEES